MHICLSIHMGMLLIKKYLCIKRIYKLSRLKKPQRLYKNSVTRNSHGSLDYCCDLMSFYKEMMLCSCLILSFFSTGCDSWGIRTSSGLGGKVPWRCRGVLSWLRRYWLLFQIKRKKKSCNNAAFHADIIHPLRCALNLVCDVWLFIKYLISFLLSFHINTFWFYFCSTWSLHIVFLWVVLFFNLVWHRYCPW